MLAAAVVVLVAVAYLLLSVDAHLERIRELLERRRD